VAIVIFLGNIFTGLFWMHIAVKTKDLKIISHSMKGIIKSDRLFTIPSIFFIVTGGFAAAIHVKTPILHTGWIFWSLVLFSISGIAFGWKVAPLQKKVYRLASGQDSSNNFNWQNFNKAYSAWEAWGLVALVTPVGAFVMMILKIPARGL
jgi:uncharacterized membrane protein